MKDSQGDVTPIRRNSTHQELRANAIQALTAAIDGLDTCTELINLASGNCCKTNLAFSGGYLLRLAREAQATKQAACAQLEVLKDSLTTNGDTD